MKKQKKLSQLTTLFKAILRTKDELEEVSSRAGRISQTAVNNGILTNTDVQMLWKQVSEEHKK